MPDPTGGGDTRTADLALLTEAALGAGKIARRHFGQGPRSWEKGDGQGPVTEADLEVNDYLHARLLEARPDYGWLSEESAPLENTARLHADTVFVIDPIDGTRAFIDGQKSFAHAMAVVRQGVPVAAVVHLPMMDLTYRAIAGQGAWLNDRPLAVSARSTLDGARVLATRPVMEPGNWPGGVPRVARHFRPSLAWRLALVGEGAFDAMVTLRDTWDWDIAAAALIAAEAGARVTDRFGGALRFNSHSARNPGLLAASDMLHAGLMKALGAETAPEPPQQERTRP
ncbi:MAG: 3'(2'),5'-bisphosphate nucleotidase CysQ [Pararhodobacter sp.]